MSRGYVDLRNPVSDHPLNAGLVTWWLPLNSNQGDYKLLDLLGGNYGGFIPGTTAPAWGVSSGYPAVNFANPGQTNWISTTRLIGLSGGYARTLSGYVRVLSFGLNSGVLRMGPSGTAAADFSIETRGSGTLGFNGWFNDFDFSCPSDGSWFHVAISYDGSVNTAYVNGRQAGSASMSLNTIDVGMAAASPRLSSLGVNNGSGGYCNMWLYSAMLHRRSLNAGQVWSLYDQSRRNFPDLLRKFNRNAYANFTTAAPVGNYFDPYTTRVNSIVTCGVL